MSFTASIQDLIDENANGLLSTASHWPRVALGELVHIKNGEPLPSSRFNSSKGVPVVRIRNVLDGVTDTFFDGPTEESWFIEHGDLLIGMDGDFNCARWKGPRSLLNQRVCQIKPKNGRVSTAYLTHVLPGYLAVVNKHTSAITVKHLSSKTVAALPIPIPPPAEQLLLVQKLETQLSRIDDAAASLAHAKANIQRARASILKAAVEGRLVPTEAELARTEGREYEPASVLLERILKVRREKWEASGKKGKYKEPVVPDADELPDLPEGWVWVTVDQVATAAEYGTSAKCDEDDSGVPVLRMGNLVDGRLDLTRLKYLRRNHPDFPRQFLRPGELLFNRTNSSELVGKTAVYSGTPSPCACASYLIRLSLADGVSSEFVSTTINSPRGRAWVRSVVSQQVGQANVNGSKLKAFAFPLPPQEEQQRIAGEMMRRHSILEALTSSFATAKARVSSLRQSLLASAFEGHL